MFGSSLKLLRLFNWIARFSCGSQKSQDATLSNLKFLNMTPTLSRKMLYFLNRSIKIDLFQFYQTHNNTKTWAQFEKREKWKMCNQNKNVWLLNSRHFRDLLNNFLRIVHKIQISLNVLIFSSFYITDGFAEGL